MLRRHSIRLIYILVLVAAAVWVVLPSNPGINLPFFKREIKIIQGLDLQGGLRVLMEADLPEDAQISSEQLQTARDIIEKRVNGLGVTEPVVQVAGSRRILVELPGIGDPEVAIATIKETGLLEFVEMDRNDLTLVGVGDIITTDFGQVAPEDATDQASTPETDVTATSDRESTPEPTPTTTPEAILPGTQPSQRVFRTIMTGAQLENAGVDSDQLGNISVVFEMSEEGRKIFSEYTSAHVGGFLGIALDKVLISTPVIQTPITEKTAQITGDFTLEEANSLAVQLRFGALPIPLTIVENKAIGPTLGQDSLQKSTLAGLIGLGVVMSFMALYYRLPGIMADLALLLYATITFALFKLIPVTLTLPGIAGFVLSIGVAVDANVLIFERMKEELRDGRTLRLAIDNGFSRAWPSIRDSNLSTLITCAILYWFGNAFGASIVKGFSLTLALGVAVSLFTAITVTRTFLHLVLDNIRLVDHPRWFGI